MKQSINGPAGIAIAVAAIVIVVVLGFFYLRGSDSSPSGGKTTATEAKPYIPKGAVPPATGSSGGSATAAHNE